MIIESERLWLRLLEPGDAGALGAIQSDPMTMGFWPRPFTAEETGAWIERTRDCHARYGFGRYAMLLKETGALIGDCGLMRTTVNGTEVNDIGYILHHPYWGTGLATEAAAAVRDHSFQTLGLAALHANMPHDHHASRRVAEKIGMTKISEFFNERNRGIRTLLFELTNPG